MAVPFIALCPQRLSCRSHFLFTSKKKTTVQQRSLQTQAARCFLQVWVGDSPPPAARGPAPSSTAAHSLSSSSRSWCFPSSTRLQAHPNKVPNQPCLASPSFPEEGLDLLQASLSLPPGEVLLRSTPWRPSPRRPGLSCSPDTQPTEKQPLLLLGDQMSPPEPFQDQAQVPAALPQLLPSGSHRPVLHHPTICAWTFALQSLPSGELCGAQRAPELSCDIPQPFGEALGTPKLPKDTLQLGQGRWGHPAGLGAAWRGRGGRPKSDLSYNVDNDPGWQLWLRAHSKTPLNLPKSFFVPPSLLLH